jgi:hypothetical protein
MAVKSIIDIQVDDSKFLQFKSIFDDYKQSLESTPESWSDANSEMGNMVQASQLLKNDAEKRLALLQSATLEESKAEKALSKQEEARKKATEDRKKKDLESIKRWKELGSTIAGATAQLAKFAAVGLGIATGATTLGMGKLANDASAARFQSMGLGMSSGAMQAANINYSSALSNPSANLAAVRDAQQDLSKQRLFSTAGIGNYQNKSTEQLLPELMIAAQKMAKQTPQGQLAQTAQAYGYTDVFSMEDLTRFKQMSETEMKAMIAKAAQDNKALDVNNSTLKSYQDLQKQWDRFGQAMENTWIKGLEPLAPALTRFSEAIGSAFEKFMAADKLEPIINKLADGITRFSAYLTSPEAEQDLNKFMAGIKDVAATLGAFAAWVGSITPEKAMTGAALAGGGVLAVGAAGSALAGGATLPLAAAGAGGAYVGHNAYENDSAENQEWTQKLVGGIAAFMGDKDAIAAQKQIADYTKSSDKSLKNINPMSAEEYKKADTDSQSVFIKGIGDVFKESLKGQFGESSGGGSGGGGGSEVTGDQNNGWRDKVGAGMANVAAFFGSEEAKNAIAVNNGSLTSIIQGGESGKAGYNAYNRGTSGGKILGSVGSRDLESMTLAEILRDQARSKDDKQRLFAVGKYQMIPSTLKGGINALGLDPEKTKFDKATQERLMSDYLLDKKRPQISKFIRGGGDVNQAGDAAASEWASIASPITGQGKYGGGNKVGISAGQIKSGLIKAREQYQELIKSGRDEREAYQRAVNGVGNSQVKDTYALRKPTPEQQKSVMFADQGGGYNSNSSRVQINVNNSTGGSATASAVSL